MATVCANTGAAHPRATMIVKRSLRILVALLHHAELEICLPLLWITAVVKHRPVDPNPLGFGIDAERIPRPQHDVGILSNFDRSNAIVETQSPRWIYRQPTNRLVFGDH